MTTTINASNSGSGGLIQTADASGVLALQTAGITAVTVDTSQNVGIGTSSPATKLHVNGSITLQGGNIVGPSNNYAFTISADSTATSGGYIQLYSSAYPSPNLVIFGTSSSERVRIDSSGNVRLSTAGTKILNSSGNSILNQTGSVLQVVSTTKTDTFSTTSTTPVDVTGLSVSITPLSATSKILITGSVCWGQDSTVPYLVGFLLVRNSTSICIADAAGSRSRWTFGAQGIYSTDNTVYSPINYLDSPATTSATTYKVQVQAESPRTVWINRGGESDGDTSITGRFTSTITVMEIAA